MSHVGARHGEGSARGPLPIAVSAPPEVTLTRKQYPGTAAGRGARGNSWRGSMHSGRAGSAELRGGLSREGQTTRQGAGRDGVGWGWGEVGEGSPWRARASRTHSPAPPPPRPPGGGSQQPRAARAHEALALRPVSPSPAHSKPGARRVAAAAAAAQPPWPPLPREALPPPRPLGPAGRGLSAVSGPHFRIPPPVLCLPIGERLWVGRLG